MFERAARSRQVRDTPAPALAGSKNRATGVRADQAPQVRLVVGPLGDRFEREAQRSAEDERGATGPIEGSLTSGGSAGPNRSGETIPESVGETLATSGEILAEETRTFFEKRLHYNLGEVRVHTDARANASARNLHSSAYTAGNHVVLAGGSQSIGTPAARRTMAHELAHVVQHDRTSRAGEPTVIRRTPAQPVASPSSANPEIAIRAWLEQHQLAQPEEQPAEGERHVLLNGEDMGVSDAVKLAVRALREPPELVNSVILAALNIPAAKTGAGLPFIGPGNEIPGINLSGPRDAFGISPAISRTVEFSSIDDFLKEHGFKTPEVRDPTGDAVLFDGSVTTVENVANRALAVLGQYPTLKRADVLTYIRQKYVADRGGAGNQIVFGYTLVPKLAQYVSGPADPNNPLSTQHQFSVTITRQHHANDSPGLESSFQGSVTLTDHGILNLQAGGQEAIVKPLLQGWLQVSGLLQIMGSENWSRSASGSVVVSPAVQAAAGAQLLLTPTLRSGKYTFINGHVQIGLQVLGGVQRSSSGTSGVANAGFVINIPFSQ